MPSYAELTCDGVAPPLCTGETGIPNSLCIDKDLTYRWFIGDVLGELADLTPGLYLHTGATGLGTPTSRTAKPGTRPRTSPASPRARCTAPSPRGGRSGWRRSRRCST